MFGGVSGEGTVLHEVEISKRPIVCAIHAHWSHPDTVLKCDIPDFEGCEESWWVRREGSARGWGLEGSIVGGIWCWGVGGRHCERSRDSIERE